MNSRWYFPSNSGADESGLNNSLIETFNDSPIKSLAREIVQNSLDAALSGKKAIVEFKYFSIDKSTFPGREDLEEVFRKCQKFAEEKRERKAKDFFANAIATISSNRISFLRISDFNTCGLWGSDQDRGTPWHNLVRSTGSSNKEGEQGGSFGIGKGAPYACSALRTVFYSTSDKNGLKVSQGVSRLTSFKIDKYDDGTDNISQGVGYWGAQDKHKILPAQEMLSLDKNFVRTEAGTDIFIAGLRREIYDDINELQATIIDEILDGFIMAIWQEKLEIRVNSFIINKDNLATIIERFSSSLTPSVVMKYELLSNPLTEWNNIPIKISNMKIGSINLAISLRHDGNNKIAMIRSSGMKILEKDKLCPTMRYCGIALIEGKELNERLIKLENPSHNKWEPKRYEPQISQKLLSTIYESIKSKLNEVAEKVFGSTVDIEGAGDFLPDDVGVEEKKQQTTYRREITNRIVGIEKKTPKVSSIAFLSTLELGDDLSERVSGEGQVIDGTDGEGFIHTGGTRRGDGERDPDEVTFEESEQANGKQIVSVKSKHLRIFCLNKQQQIYRLIFVPTESSKCGYIAINKIAELNEKEPIKLLHVNSKEPLKIDGNQIGYFEFIENQAITLEIQIEGQDYCSMEVKIYAYKS